MGIGSGIFLLAIGAVLTWAVDFDLPYVDDDALGMILLLAGIAVTVISVVLKVDRPEAGVGTGIALIAAGAIQTWAVDFNVPFLADEALGAIFMIAGAVAVVATVVVSMQHRDRRPAAGRY